MGDIAERLADRGTDTARVDRLRKIMDSYHKERECISQYHQFDDESRTKLIQQNRRVTLNRISVVLSEDWDGS